MDTMDDVLVVREIQTLVGALTDDETALVRTLTPADIEESAETAQVQHLADLIDLFATIRSDETMADYVYAIAPMWDGTIEALLVAGRVTTVFNRCEIERRTPAYAG
jgi:hypothetical protein